MYFELSKNENKRHENLRYITIGELRGKFRDLNACFRKAKDKNKLCKHPSQEAKNKPKIEENKLNKKSRNQ